MILRYPRQYFLGALFLFILITGIYLLMIPSETSEYLRAYLRKYKHNEKAISKMLVVASVKGQNTSWIDGLDWEKTIMVPEPPLRNKGREANMYLAYIIDNYDNLHDITAFTHHHSTAWHIDAPAKSNAEMLSHLRLSYVQEEGYVSFRCGNIPGGCDKFLRPFESNETTMMNYPKAYEYMFNATAPEVLAAPCCAQFAVAKSHILSRSKEDYKRYHQWLMDTELEDKYSGRIFEFLWHIIFGKDHVLCPNTKACWCNMYGWCDKGTFFPRSSWL